MKVIIFGNHPDEFATLVKSVGLEIVQHNPDLVISYGGDGTLISSEREYPGIPKLPIRRDSVSQKCSEHQNDLVLKKLLDNTIELVEYPKLKTSFFYKDFLALNDFVIRNASPIHTIRFKINAPVEINPDQLYIGDGIVIATSFGSSGYFKSITNKTFADGFALAFNNTTEQTAPIYLKPSNTITFELVRGQATLSYDNSPDIFNLDEGSQIAFSQSDQVAKIYAIDNLRCLNCKVKRDVINPK